MVLKQQQLTSNNRGMACIWIGVGTAYPTTAMLATRRGSSLYRSTRSLKLAAGSQTSVPWTWILCLFLNLLIWKSYYEYETKNDILIPMSVALQSINQSMERIHRLLPANPQSFNQSTNQTKNQRTPKGKTGFDFRTNSCFSWASFCISSVFFFLLFVFSFRWSPSLESSVPVYTWIWPASSKSESPSLAAGWLSTNSMSRRSLSSASEFAASSKKNMRKKNWNRRIVQNDERNYNLQLHQEKRKEIFKLINQSIDYLDPCRRLLHLP